jgi:hypothetical protein
VLSPDECYGHTPVVCYARREFLKHPTFIVVIAPMLTCYAVVKYNNSYPKEVHELEVGSVTLAVLLYVVCGQYSPDVL